MLINEMRWYEFVEAVLFVHQDKLGVACKMVARKMVAFGVIYFVKIVQ